MEHIEPLLDEYEDVLWFSSPYQKALRAGYESASMAFLIFIVLWSILFIIIPFLIFSYAAPPDSIIIFELFIISMLIPCTLITYIFILNLILLYGSSHYVVHYGTELALGLALPPIFIGLFFLALGTSLPELVFELRAMMSNHPQMALGDLIGSVIMNSTLVLAVTAFIFPITTNFFLFLTSALFMILATVLFAAFVRSGERFTYLEGISLLILYILFIIVELNVQQYFV